MDFISVFYNLLQKSSREKSRVCCLKESKEKSGEEQNKKKTQRNLQEEQRTIPGENPHNSHGYSGDRRSTFYISLGNFEGNDGKIEKGAESTSVKILTGILRFYRKWISPAFPTSCRFYPSCSQYAIEAIEKKGILKGIFLSILRVLRCNPFNSGGYDPLR